MTTPSIRDLATNPVLIGLIGAMLTGWVLYLCKAVPLMLLDFLVDAVTVRVVVLSDDEIFDWLNDWLAKHAYAKRARRLKVSTQSLQADWVLAPGYGQHLLWEGGAPIMVTRESVDKAQSSGLFNRRSEKLTFTTLGRSQARLRALIGQADVLRQRRDKLEVRVWQDGYWAKLARKNKRPLESVFLAEGKLDEILAEARWFFGAEAWHHELGLPYRQGWQFEGPPGTGKTTVAMVVASYFDRPICILNLATVPNDNALLAAFTSADPRCILLIEDIDAAEISKERSDAAPVPSEKKVGITLSGLLNAIDGVASADGRLLIMTTNHPEHLDAALTRSNRVDKRWHFGSIRPRDAAKMAERFFPQARAWLPESVRLIAAAQPARTASDWQSLMLRSRQDPHRLVALAQEKQ